MRTILTASDDFTQCFPSSKHKKDGASCLCKGLQTKYLQSNAMSHTILCEILNSLAQKLGSQIDSNTLELGIFKCNCMIAETIGVHINEPNYFLK